jgi:hypothetical protein
MIERQDPLITAGGTMKNTKRWAPYLILAVLLAQVFMGQAQASSQDRFDLPQPYLAWERDYLRAFPQLQVLMDEMIRVTSGQLQDPAQDILHNRVCAALAYHMAVDYKSPARTQKLAAATDLLHNIAKEDKASVLSDAKVYQAVAALTTRLKASGKLQGSPEFFSERAVLLNAKVSDNSGLIHHLTSATMASEILHRLGGYTPEEITEIETAIVEHSTGYWYFRASVDEAAGRKGAWAIVYPEPENDIARFAHDADLISQFVPESVIPDGAKWRNLAKKRWGAKNTREEGQIVYYVFYRLYGEAKTEPGKALAKEKWDVIRPALLQLMNLPAQADPIQQLGVPKTFE